MSWKRLNKNYLRSTTRYVHTSGVILERVGRSKSFWVGDSRGRPFLIDASSLQEAKEEALKQVAASLSQEIEELLRLKAAVLGEPC